MGKALVPIIAVYFLCLLANIEAQNCESKYGPTGSISMSGSNSRCWNIYMPFDSFIRLNLTKLSFNYRGCNSNFLKISTIGSNEEYKYCESISNTNPVTALNNVTVSFYTSLWNSHGSFELQYEIQDIECSRKDSFRCTKYNCIPRRKVCDGIKHCKNGEDEVGCETGVLAIGGVAESRERAITWMKGQSTTAWGWKENTPRAVVALFLASAANFNGSVLEEEFLVKQAELRIAVALFRSNLTNSELSMLVNALLVTCHNPRHFFGKNLVKHLKTQVEASQNFTHPAAYLALCNANETLPEKAINDLKSILSSNSSYPFVRDIQAMAAMALACITNFNKNLYNGSQALLYRDVIRRFKTFQQQDGSFGNAHTTFLITQALIASGHEQNKDWNLNATIEYLMRELNSSSVDFLSMYLGLPILNGKTLVDISKTNCSANPRKLEDITSEINDYLGSKIQIKYFLYVGDEKSVIYSISLRVPENFTAYEVMQLAAAEDIKYKFEEKRVSGKIYVYEIAKVTNDPEAGKFWLLYISSSNNGTSELIHSSKGPDELIMKDGQHLVMWYKTAHL